jgi:hypothetical protein
MKFKFIPICAATMLLFSSIKADEGMWLPSFLSQVNIEKMQKMGLELTANDIYNINSTCLKDAIIVLDGGSCTGELVSPEGLFLTNHHCGYGEIQNHSTPENNILKNGFWAKTRDEELANPGKTVSFLIRVEDVTDSINAVLTTEMDEDTREDSIASVSWRLEAAAIKDSHYEAVVKDLYESNRFYLFVSETFRDVRLVATPPHFIGKFGGDTDNWMWPRHTGDFSIFRIYSAPDGTPADYAAENVPLKSRHFLPISLKGYENGDFAMILGYPGTTNRYLTSDGVKHTIETVNDIRIDVRKEKLRIIGDYMATSDEATIKYASKYARSSNYYKYSIGQNRGLKRLDVVQKKKEIEGQFSIWANETNERKEKYGDVLKMLSEAYTNTDDDIALQYLVETLLRGPEIFAGANLFSDLNNALKKDKSNELINRYVSSLKDTQKDFFNDYDAATDEKLVASLTQIYIEKVNPKYYPAFVKTIKGKYKGDYNKWASDLFKKSIFDNEKLVDNLLTNPKKSSLAKDPALKISGQLYKVLKDVRKDNEADIEKMDKGYRLYLAGLMEMDPEMSFYPNANSTMRITWGQVGDYYPADAVHYDYFTTLNGYIEKEIPGDREFDVWPSMKELYNKKEFGQYADKDGTLHTCFITNNDITGGNSGSPVINGKGELIGIAFDGNWEAMSGDIAFEPQLQKCINVDIRFVLWTIDKFAGATHLIDEMTIVR